MNRENGNGGGNQSSIRNKSKSQHKGIRNIGGRKKSDEEQLLSEEREGGADKSHCIQSKGYDTEIKPLRISIMKIIGHIHRDGGRCVRNRI